MPMSVVPMRESMVWEVKSITYLGSKRAHNKYNTMVDYSSPKVQKGQNSYIGQLKDIPVLEHNPLGTVYMAVDAPSFDQGFVYYSLYIKRPNEETGAEEVVAVSNRQAKDIAEKKLETTEQILEFVAGVALGEVAGGTLKITNDFTKDIGDYLLDLFDKAA